MRCGHIIRVRRVSPTQVPVKVPSKLAKQCTYWILILHLSLDLPLHLLQWQAKAAKATLQIGGPLGINFGSTFLSVLQGLRTRLHKIEGLKGIDVRNGNTWSVRCDSVRKNCQNGSQNMSKATSKTLFSPAFSVPPSQLLWDRRNFEGLVQGHLPRTCHSDQSYKHARYP